MIANTLSSKLYAWIISKNFVWLNYWHINRVRPNGIGLLSAKYRRSCVSLFRCSCAMCTLRESKKTKCSTNGNKWLWCEIAFQLRPCVFMERKFKIYLKQLFIVHNNQAIFGFVNEFCFSLRKANEKQSVCDCWIETINWIWGLFSPSNVYHTMTQPVDMPIPKHTQTNSPFCLFSVIQFACVRYFRVSVFGLVFANSDNI